MSIKSAEEHMQEIITKLAAEGVHAYIEQRDVDQDEENQLDVFEHESSVLRVPAWETEDHYLSKKSVYAFINSKLAGQGNMAFVAKVPGSDAVTDIYAYYPLSVEDGAELNADHILVNGACSQFDQFCWEEAVDGDDSAWDNGWDISGVLEHLPSRVANLATILNYDVRPLPAPKPFTIEEFVERLKSKSGSSIFCHGPDYNNRWELRISVEGVLVLHMVKENTDTPITPKHIDDKGRLVFDGRVILHRCWGW